MKRAQEQDNKCMPRLGATPQDRHIEQIYIRSAELEKQKPNTSQRQKDPKRQLYSPFEKDIDMQYHQH